MVSLPAALHSFANSVDVLDPPIAPPSPASQFTGASANTEPAPDPKRSSHFARMASEETRLAAAPEKDLSIQSRKLARVEVPMPSPPLASLRAETRFETHHPATEDGVSLRTSLPEPNSTISGEMPASSGRLMAELPAAQKARRPERTSPAPILSPPGRAESGRGSLPPPRQETPDPIIEVSIARVDVRLDPPKQPAPQPVGRPRGFAEYESQRRYITSPWARRR